MRRIKEGLNIFPRNTRNKRKINELKNKPLNHEVGVTLMVTLIVLQGNKLLYKTLKQYLS
jgi:hypothetical protein